MWHATSVTSGQRQNSDSEKKKKKKKLPTNETCWKVNEAPVQNTAYLTAPNFSNGTKTRRFAIA